MKGRKPAGKYADLHGLYGHFSRCGTGAGQRKIKDMKRGRKTGRERAGGSAFLYADIEKL